MRFDDVAGSAETDSSHLRVFLYHWYRPEDILALVGIPMNGSRQVVSFAETAQNLSAYSGDDIYNMSFMAEEGKRMNMYMSINPLIEDHAVTLNSRGSKKDVARIYGTFIDFDVNKPGAFENKDQILKFLDSLQMPPTIVVDNGVNGGMHAYWRLNDEDVDKADEPIMVRWWAYMSSLTDKKIDKLIDKTRISRMPSGVYWPKDDDQKIDTVKVVRWKGPRYSLDDLMTATQKPYEEHQTNLALLRHQKTRIEPGKWEDHVRTTITGESRWGLNNNQINIVLTRLDQFIEENFTWYDILEPAGWTFLKENSDGTLSWARPGRNERSATTGYEHPDGRISGVISLQSTAEETNLADLKEANVPLSKKQVMLRLLFEDDVVAMIDHLFERMYDVEKLGRSV